MGASNTSLKMRPLLDLTSLQSRLCPTEHPILVHRRPPTQSMADLTVESVIAHIWNCAARVMFFGLLFEQCAASALSQTGILARRWKHPLRVLFYQQQADGLPFS